MKLLVVNKRQAAITLFCLLIAVSFSIFALAIIPRAIATTGEAREIPIHNVEKADKIVSLSFDAAWGNVILR